MTLSSIKMSDKLGGGGPRLLRFGLTTVALVVVLIVALFIVGSCSVTVESGEVGIKSTRFGANPGVQRQELRPGWHWEGFGEKIIIYPTRQRTYSYTRERNSDGVENEEIGFADQTGLPLTADVNLTFRVREDMAADLYAKWRQPFEDLLDGQIRNDVRSFIAKEAEKVPVSCSVAAAAAAVEQAPDAEADGRPATRAEECAGGSLMGSGRQAVIQRAFVQLQRKWAAEGVDVSQMEWIGTLRYPPAITEAIQARTQAEQATLAAQATVARAKAQADAQIETARGQAEATRLLAQSISANPEVVELRAIEKWDGHLPTYMGGDSVPFINVGK
jgi:regulator of protease activity HflC (stomatin/prohibitin superfamily)